MATFTAERPLNFHTMSYLDTLVSPGAVYNSSVLGFDVYDEDTIVATGAFPLGLPGSKPAGGVINSLDVDHGSLFPEAAFRISGMNTDFNALQTAIINGGTQAGLGLILAGSDIINGSSGNDLLDGYGGADTIKGGGGADKLYGGYGDDKLQGQAGKDFIDGGIGADIASYEEKSDSVVVKLRGSEIAKVKVDGKVEDKIMNVEGLYGGAAKDSLTGDAMNNTFYGFDGNDTLKGKGGIDKLFGGAGKDTLLGGGGIDSLFGGSGNDKLKGGGGNDNFHFSTALNAKSNVDTILDFKPGVDHFVLSQTVFSAIDAGEIAGNTFFALNKPTSASSHIIYKAESGKVFYDATGNAAGGDAVLFAKVKPGTNLTADDFMFVA